MVEAKFDFCSVLMFCSMLVMEHQANSQKDTTTRKKWKPIKTRDPGEQPSQPNPCLLDPSPPVPLKPPATASEGPIQGKSMIQAATAIESSHPS
jgi:hypothetical protein